MGFDNECILNIQSLAGEYFCPVCRTLVYPHEAVQTQCTHLYCKPCLSYVVSSTQACPYDGYLVTEAGSKPLMESNKALAETIGKTTVHCLYHRSGCVWQGPLSDCTTHCSGCAFGNSPVVCNRCGIQIVHRQVQEHAQTCNVNGTNTQSQGGETAHDGATSGVTVSTDQSKNANQAAAPTSQPQASHIATGPSAVQNVNQPATVNSLPQGMPATAVPTPDQQYYQQYQQYYQQYPGYDPYQQGYQQYYPYQQPPVQPFQPQTQSQPQLQQQVQAPMQLQPQVQPPPQVQIQAQNNSLTQAQGQGQPQSQTHPQVQPQISSNVQPQPLYPQSLVVGSSQNQGQVNPQLQGHPGGQPLVHGHMPPQSYSQVQPYPVQNHAQPHMQAPPYQQPHAQMHHPQPPQVQPLPHPQVHPHFQPHLQPQPQSQPINTQHPPVQSVGGPPVYQSQPHQPIQHAPPQQHPMQVQPSGSLPPGHMPAQFPPPPPQMRPPQPPHMLPPQQRPIMHQVHQPMAQQYMQQPQAFPGQAPGQLLGLPHHAGPFAHQHSQVRPPGPPQPMQQPPAGYVQPQLGTALPHGMPPHPSQIYVGRPAMLNQGGQSQQFSQSSGAAVIPPYSRLPQFDPSQPSVNQSNVNMTNEAHVYSDQKLPESRVEQREDKSPSMKKPEPAGSDFGTSFNEVKHEAGMNDERMPGNGGDVNQRKDEALTKDAVSESHHVQRVPGDSVTTHRVKEESKDGALDHSPSGKLSQNKAEDGGVATIDSVKQGETSVNFQGSSDVNNSGNSQGPFSGRDLNQQGTKQSSYHAPLTEQGRSPHPPVPYGLPGQQQRPTAQTMGQPSSHLRPTGPGYLPHGSHPGEHFQPPGPNLPGLFHPEASFSGPPGPGSASTLGGGPSNYPNNRGYETQSVGHARLSRMSQGDPLGPPLPHGPDSRHPGPMDSDMYRNQRPPHFDSRPDSHLPGNVDRVPYGQPFGVESNSMRMNGGPPQGHESSSAPVFRDEKFRTSAGMHPDTFSMAPTRHHDQGPPHLGGELSPKFGSYSSRPMSGYGMDGPSRFLDHDSHGYGYHSAGGFHPNESGGRPLPASIHDDNRGRFDDNHHNPDFLGPMHGFGRHNMDRLPPNSPGNPSRPFGGPHNIDIDGREMERHPFGERFAMGPPGHMHRGEFDGPVKPRSGEPFGLRNMPGRGEPGFGSFPDYGPGESNGPGDFSHQPPFGESFSIKSGRPHLGEPGFRSNYSRQGFPSDVGFYSGGPDSFDQFRKRKTLSMGWCRICKVDCESVEGLDMHGQTREHQMMAMDMVMSIKQKNAKKQKTSSNHSSREEASKFRNS